MSEKVTFETAEAMFIEDLLDVLDAIDVWADMHAHTQWALVRKDRSR